MGRRIIPVVVALLVGAQFVSPAAASGGSQLRLFPLHRPGDGASVRSSALVRHALRMRGYLVPNERGLARAKVAAKSERKPVPQTAIQALAASVLRGWEGVADPTGAPSDSTGAIGRTRYIETVNTRFAIYDRTHNGPLASGTLQELAGDDPGAFVTDPQVIWDPGTNRFYYVVLDATLAVGGGFGSHNVILFGWSKTGSPSSAADFCQFGIQYDDSQGAWLPDYPKLGDTKNFLLVGVNTFDGAGNPFGSDAVWIKKPAAGMSCPTTFPRIGARFQLKNANGSFTFTPVPANQTDTSATGWIVSSKWVGGGSGGFLTLYKVTKKADGSANIPGRGVSVPVTSYAIPPAAPQAGATEVIDTLDTRLTQAVSAIDPRRGTSGLTALWTQHTVRGGAGAQVRWYEINPGAHAVFQSGKVSSSSLYVFNGAVSPDRKVVGTTRKFGANMVLGYNTSSASADIAVRMVSKRGGGTQSLPVLVHSSGGPNVDTSCNDPVGAPCRWGDYAAATPDPAAPATATQGQVWLTNAWNVASASSGDVDWRTWNWAARP